MSSSSWTFSAFPSSGTAGIPSRRDSHSSVGGAASSGNQPRRVLATRGIDFMQETKCACKLLLMEQFEEPCPVARFSTDGGRTDGLAEPDREPDDREPPAARRRHGRGGA